ncbi:MAG: hypothetical protein FWC34_02095 [Bacteroidetes bacterium]|nr:hypothetical protein [Bacteroidota bacterium]MCL2303198.1 hypothetical protein [Lentimicrobiaceae bacterium]
MEQHLKGNRYDYVVKYSDNGYFEISTIRKKDGRKSAITNLNRIISEVIEPILNTIYVEESYLYVIDKEVGRKLYQTAIEVLSDKQWVSQYLEKELDDDIQDEL